jgi:pilus assembly protein Flp/PilA
VISTANAVRPEVRMSAWTACKHLIQSEDGPTTVEYAVMLAFIIIVCVSAIASLGQAVSSSFNAANGAFS